MPLGSGVVSHEMAVIGYSTKGISFTVASRLAHEAAVRHREAAIRESKCDEKTGKFLETTQEAMLPSGEK